MIVGGALAQATNRARWAQNRQILAENRSGIASQTPQPIFHNFFCEKSENSALPDGRFRDSSLQSYRMRPFWCHAKAPLCFKMELAGAPSERFGMSESGDRELLDLIRRRGPLTVTEMGKQLGVTGTAVRNRLARLLGTGLVERKAEHGGRGRPRHRYQASVEAHKRLGQNYADLALALWEEMMGSVADRKLRRLVFTRITERLADVYRTKVTGQEWEGRLVQLSSILHDRGVEAEVTRDDAGLGLILRQHSCPYYELAEADRAICALERKMFEKVLGRGLRLSQCRLDGDRSCDFQAKPAPMLASKPTCSGQATPTSSSRE
jgi:DeoR family suf operon transcriptional repressor